MHYIPLYLYQVKIMGVAEVQKSHLFQSWLNDDDNVDDSLVVTYLHVSPLCKYSFSLIYIIYIS